MTTTESLQTEDVKRQQLAEAQQKVECLEQQLALVNARKQQPNVSNTLANRIAQAKQDYRQLLIGAVQQECMSPNTLGGHTLDPELALSGWLQQSGTPVDAFLATLVACGFTIEDYHRHFMHLYRRYYAAVEIPEKIAAIEERGIAKAKAEQERFEQEKALRAARLSGAISADEFERKMTCHAKAWAESLHDGLKWESHDLLSRSRRDMRETTPARWEKENGELRLQAEKKRDEWNKLWATIRELRKDNSPDELALLEHRQAHLEGSNREKESAAIRFELNKRKASLERADHLEQEADALQSELDGLNRQISDHDALMWDWQYFDFEPVTDRKPVTFGNPPRAEDGWK